MSAKDWDAVTYDRISAPQQAWASEQLERLQLSGGETVLDAGCGSGKITALLADMVGPAGRVYGVDAAPSMAEHTQQALGDRATILCQDLARLELPEPMDAIFSNATFHWIPDHDALFAALHRALKPGGQLVAQCGGKGNVDSCRRAAEALAEEDPFRAHFAGWQQPWTYATAEETSERLTRAGFAEVQTWLEPRPTNPPEPREFTRTVCLVRHLDVLPADLHDRFIDEVMARVVAERGEPFELDYVRLNMTARRA